MPSHPERKPDPSRSESVKDGSSNSGQPRRRYESPVLKRWGPIEDYAAGDTGGNTDGGLLFPVSTMLL